MMYLHLLIYYTVLIYEVPCRRHVQKKHTTTASLAVATSQQRFFYISAFTDHTISTMKANILLI